MVPESCRGERDDETRRHNHGKRSSRVEVLCQRKPKQPDAEPG